MRLLRHDELPEVPSERVFRHGRIAGFVLLAIVAAPLVAASIWWHEILRWASTLHAFGWIIVTPIALGWGFVWLLFFVAAQSLARAGLLSTNWVARVSAAGVGLHLRSFQNAHFGGDAPTVLWLERGEIARARRVVESGWVQGPRNRMLLRKSWLELELAGVDTDAIAKCLELERREQGPEQRLLGIRTRTRSNDVPVYVERPGVLRVDWLGGSMLEALREVAEVAPEVQVDLETALGREFEPRVRALCARGWRMVAYELLRRERGMGWREAKLFVEDVERRAA